MAIVNTLQNLLHTVATTDNQMHEIYEQFNIIRSKTQHT